MKKKIGGFLAVLAGVAGAIIAARQPHAPAPGPVTPPEAAYTLVVHVFKGDPGGDHKLPGAQIRGAGRDAVADGAGNAALERIPAGRYSVCAAAAGYVERCEDATVPGKELNVSLWADTPPAVTLAPLTTDGPIFRAGGEPFRYRGVTAFGLLNRFAKGEDIGPFLEDFAGFNVLRVFWYVTWPGTGWEPQPADVVLAFLKRVEQAGFYVELVLLTDDDAGRIEPARRLVAALGAARPANLLLEAGNEPTTHKAIDTPALREALAASGFPHSSGDYEDSGRFYGSYLTTHTGRDGDWPRRAHDLLDYFIGGGPNAPSDPAHRVPIVADEPIRPDQAQGDRDQDFLAYFATCSLLGGGATYHFESGKYGNRPTDDEKRIAAVALKGLTAFPADAPKGPYQRIDESGATLRTYRVGPYTVRIRPTDGRVLP